MSLNYVLESGSYSNKFITQGLHEQKILSIADKPIQPSTDNNDHDQNAFWHVDNCFFQLLIELYEFKNAQMKIKVDVNFSCGLRAKS